MKNNLPKKILFLALFSGIAIVVISFMKQALELEDAEQAYYSQWWRWGYDDQPPLYTWLQIAINAIFGVSKFSFSFLRGLIFSCSLLVVYQFAMKILKNRNKALLVVFSLVLVPTYIDFTFRRLSHTSLMVLAIVVTCLIINRLFKRKTIFNYMLFGVVLSMGVLTKYNYVLFIGALGILTLFNKEFRKVLWNKRMLIVVVLLCICVLPHLYWLLSSQNYITELNASIRLKSQVEVKEGIVVISSLFSFLKATIKLVFPLLLLLSVAFFFKKIQFKKQNKNNWLLQLATIQIIVLVLVFVVMNVKRVEARWLLPLFIPYLVLLINMIKIVSVKKYVQYGFYIFSVALVFQLVRTPIEKIAGISSSIHFGFQPISEKLQKDYYQADWILPDVTYAGNIHVLNPDKEIFSMDDYSLSGEKINRSKTVFVFKNEKPEASKYTVVDSIQGFGKERENLFFTYLRN